jgi:pyruvate,water dikinase
LSDAVASAADDLAGADCPLVVRSSSTVEDIGASSMAGQFLSLLDVGHGQELLTAVSEVQRSSLRPVGEGPPAPMAVLVQQQLRARVGGVMFGLDPVSGDREHILVEAVPGGPEQLVSGTVTAQRFLLGRHGRVIEGPQDGTEQPLLNRRLRRLLVRMSEQARRSFGTEQDIEWALDDQEHLWLLQARPVTAVGAGGPLSGPLLGPGPVGETFPDPLQPLEQDLWLEPLARGIESAIGVIGAVPARELAASPVVTTIGGRVACDLQLLGAAPPRSGAWRVVDPRAGMRKLISSWRVGRLRAVLPELAQQMCHRVDAELAALPPMADLSDSELLELIQHTRCYLASVHGHEVLAGTLLPGGSGASAAGAAMTVLTRGRALGLDDAQISQRWPVALALTVPRIGPAPDLPPCDGDAQGPQGLPMAAQLDELPPREALRLRSRWLQELTAVAAAALAKRLAASGRIAGADQLPMLTLAELTDIIAGWPAPQDLGQRSLRTSPPLPSAFRLDPSGCVVRVQVAGAHRAGGRGASQGRVEGAVVQDPAAARPGDILVTRTLDPRLAPWLPQLGGIVSETGSVLSHLAILAREYGVPAVVAVHDAVERFPAGTRLLVDGSTGEVRPGAAAVATGGAP